MLANCNNLDDYFGQYGALLGSRATQSLDPLHVPSRDPVHPAIPTLLRPPLPAQAHVITAIAGGWDRQKSLIFAGQMGVGKTLCAAGAAHLHAAGRPYRALVMCPDHLIDKWSEEILMTLPGVNVHHFAGWRDVLEITTANRRPEVPDWYLIGRDQSKYDPTWRQAPEVRQELILEPKEVRRIRRHRPLADFVGRVARCPRCGSIVADKDGNPIPLAKVMESKKRRACEGFIVRWRRVGDEVKELVTPCGEPLWQFTRKPWRWASYRIIHRSRWRPDYLVLDEAHELDGGDDVAQANSAGTLIACAKRVLALTGTLIGGYAESLFPLLLRLDARTLRASGYEWNGYAAFNAKYGKIETTVYTKRTPAEDGPSNRHSKGSTRTTRTSRPRPGIMPQIYGDHLADKTIFLTLDQVADDLPGLTEEIVPVRPDPDQADAYRDAQAWFRDVIKRMLVRGDKRLLGRMLQTLLCYPDYPFGWSAIAGPDGDEFSPRNLDETIIRPKEEALIDVVRRERALGRQCWIYTVMTQIRDCGARLGRLLEEAGFKAVVMKSSVDRRKRAAWIAAHGDADCVISHPKLVETGMDFFARDRSYNFPSLVFYQTGYQLSTMRQAAARSYRIGQWLPCRTTYLYYQGTIQERALALMGRKLVAAEAIEGKFSSDGLVALAEEDDATMALARALVERVDDPAERAWAKSLGFGQAGKPQSQAPPPPSAATTTHRVTLMTHEEMELFRKLQARA